MAAAAIGPSFESEVLSMPSHLRLMGINQRQRCNFVWCEQGNHRRVEVWSNERPASIIETDETGIERSIPVCGKQQAVENVQSLLVASATCPGDDMARAEQRTLGDARERAFIVPVIEQGTPEIALPNPLAGDPFDLCVAQTRYIGLELG